MLDVVPFGGMQWPLEGLALLFLLAGVILPFSQWSTLPARIPSHFNIMGKPDRWGGRWVFVFFAALQIFIYCMFSLQGRSLDYLSGEPLPFTAVAFLMLWTKLVIEGLFCYLIWTMIRVARAQAEKANIFLMLLFSALLVAPILLLKMK
ncbi:DUF1648 domain-containing protein [Paludibaculum fermentans]|uniref:DUF1648 domain-containing protein n=1 Tax=Paludibaculum fermentans TaxID=1473598 RepID=UPI003EBA65BA